MKLPGQHLLLRPPHRSRSLYCIGGINEIVTGVVGVTLDYQVARKLCGAVQETTNVTQNCDENQESTSVPPDLFPDRSRSTKR